MSEASASPATPCRVFATEQEDTEPQARLDQVSPDEAEPRESAPETRPLAEGEIPARADVVAAALRRIEALVRTEAGIARIAEALPLRELSTEALRGELDAIDPGRTGGQRLENMRLPWLELDKELTGWKSRIDARFTDLQENRDRLREDREQWEATLESISAEELPELAGRVEAVLERVVELEGRVRERRNAVGAVSERIAASLELVSDALEEIDALALRLRERKLERGAPPLWRTFRGGANQSIVGEPAQAWGDWIEGLVDYTRLRPGRAAFLPLCFFALLSVLHQVRRRREATSSVGELSDRARALLDRPVSVALACALAITLVVLPVPSGSASDAVLFLVLIPLLRLGAVVLEVPQRRTLYGVVLLLVLLRLDELVLGDSLGARLLLLVVTILALLRALQRARHTFAGTAAQRWGLLVGMLIVLAAVVLAVAVVANVLGWVQLSSTLTEATIVSVFSALGWMVTLSGLRSLLPLAIAGRPGDWLSSVRRNQATVIRVVLRGATFVAVVLWLQTVLTGFELRDAFVGAARRLVESEFDIGGLTIATGGLLGAVVVLVVIAFAARLIEFLLREEILPKLQLRRGAGASLITVTKYAIWGAGLALAASSLGLSGTQLAVVIGALGVGIGFGLQNIVNNFVSGLILIVERPIKVGDTLEMPSCWGRVERIGIRASVIRSFDGAEVIVPNGELISREVVNWTGSDEFRRGEILVGVAYGTDPEQVLGILQEVAQQDARVRGEPPVKVQMLRFGESSLDFRLRFWTLIDDWIDVMSDLHVAITRRFKEAGVTIPFPQRDLHVKSMAEPPSSEGAALPQR